MKLQYDAQRFEVLVGLIRYAKPVSTISNTWSLVGASTAHEAIDDTIGTYVVRGLGGGVTTDLANDGDFLRALAGSSVVCELTFGAIPGDDDLSALTFHIRAQLTGAGSETLNVRHLHGIEVSVGSVTINSTAWANYSLTSVGDAGANNANWGVAHNLPAGGVAFRFITAPVLAGVRVSRIYVEGHFTVGPTLGRDKREENWRFCDVCGFKQPYSRLQRPISPHPQAGLVVCPYCYDQPDHDTIKAINSQVPTERDEPLY